MDAIDIAVEAFAAEINLAEKQAEGETDPELVDQWYVLSLYAYSGHQLLEALHRHVRGLVETGSEYHLQLLKFVAEEIERRRQQAEAEYN